MRITLNTDEVQLLPHHEFLDKWLAKNADNSYAVEVLNWFENGWETPLEIDGDVWEVVFDAATPELVSN